MRPFPGFFLSALLLSCFCSCDFFGPPHQSVHVEFCNTYPAPIVIDTITNEYGRVALIDAIVDSVPCKRWVIIPDQPATTVYDACNLPQAVCIDWQKIYFSAYRLKTTPTTQDTVLGGMLPIELTYISKD